MKITVDDRSGYCFGVEYAIQMAEDALKEGHGLYCLGDIVHNDIEVARLKKMGLVVIGREALSTIRNARVLIRAHGEPPETYRIAADNNLELVDASCPVVLKLQSRVKQAFDQMIDRSGQVIIYGKEGHAEVIGLEGQTNENALVIGEESDIDRIDFDRPAVLFSQTTKSTRGFQSIVQAIEKRYGDVEGSDSSKMFEAHDSICRQVSNREPHLKQFAMEQDVILFVSGSKSSNGRALFHACKSVNPRSYFIETEQEVRPGWLRGHERVGICGATSTPMWLMQNVAKKLEKLSKKVPTT